jgi:hypothetical protein
MSIVDITKVKSITNVISESILIELNEYVVELEPGKTLHNVEIKNLGSVRPYTKVIENLNEALK